MSTNIKRNVPKSTTPDNDGAEISSIPYLTPTDGAGREAAFRADFTALMQKHDANLMLAACVLPDGRVATGAHVTLGRPPLAEHFDL